MTRWPPDTEWHSPGCPPLPPELLTRRYTFAEVLGRPALRHQLASILAHGVGEEVSWRLLDQFTDEAASYPPRTVRGWAAAIRRWAFG